MCVCFLRTDHHSGRREHPSGSHRGRRQRGRAAHQQRHADRRQEEVPVYAAHHQGNCFRGRLAKQKGENVRAFFDRPTS